MRSRCGVIALCLILLLYGCSHTKPEDTPTPSSSSVSPPALVSSESEPTPSAPLWTEDEAKALAQMVWGEARGVKSVTEQAACVWCVLNRCDEWGMTILEVVSAPYQFAGYDPDYPVDDELLALCEDVLTRYFSEKSGKTDVGRVLPPDYLFFSGDGQRNHFRNAYKGGEIWDWTLPSPYES